MEPDQNRAANRPAKSRYGILLLLVAGGIVLTIFFSVRNRARPQLDLSNVGTIAVLVRFEGEDALLPAGGTYHVRFSGGETLEIFVGSTDSTISTSVTLEKRGPLAGSPPRVAAEVIADDAGTITFRYVDDP